MYKNCSRARYILIDYSAGARYRLKDYKTASFLNKFILFKNRILPEVIILRNTSLNKIKVDQNKNTSLNKSMIKE